MSKFDKDKVSISEIFNNYTGKTSTTKFIGVISSLVCLFLFIILVFYYFMYPLEAVNVLALIDKTTTYFSISAGLMGVKSITSAFGKNNNVTLTNTNNPINSQTNDEEDKTTE